jgi:hypothetical protein
MVDWISFGVVWLVRSINRIDGSRVFWLQGLQGLQEVVLVQENEEKKCVGFTYKMTTKFVIVHWDT